MNHIDVIDGQRVEHHCVVGRNRRSIDCANAIGQHPDAIAIEAAQHRARGAGGKAAGRNAGQPGQCLADLAAQLRGQRVALNRRAAGQQAEVGGRMSDDKQLRVFLAMRFAMCGILCRGGGKRKQAGAGDGGKQRGWGKAFGHHALIQVMIYYINRAQATNRQKIPLS